MDQASNPIEESEIVSSSGGIGRIEKILRETSTTQTKALFWQIPHASGKKDVSLKVGRYEKGSWIPFRRATNDITLNEEEIDALIDFVSKNFRPVKTGESKWLPVTDEAIKSYLEANPDILVRLAKDKLTSKDITALAYRKKQLDIFKYLLETLDGLQKYKEHFKLTDSDERAWQFFFEKNPWIFGYGLNYVFNSPLEGKKLRQVIVGFDFTKHGKEVDALLKTSGLVSSICLVEIKTPSADLLGAEYRNTWKPSEELSGGAQQLRNYARQTIRNLEEVHLKDGKGDPTGEELHTYIPKSYLIIGSLKEFCTEHGVNREKFFAFESFRKGQQDLEVITFDELLSRAKSIVGHEAEETQPAT